MWGPLESPGKLEALGISVVMWEDDGEEMEWACLAHMLEQENGTCTQMRERDREGRGPRGEEGEEEREKEKEEKGGKEGGGTKGEREKGGRRGGGGERETQKHSNSFPLLVPDSCEVGQSFMPVLG